MSQQVLEVSPTAVSVLLDTSEYEVSQNFKGLRMDSDGLTCIKRSVFSCLIRAKFAIDFKCPHKQKS
jgi:hypothetical protein